eukprot:jgi/Botrbrau1/3761/Bobra.0363s0038.1
MGSHKSNVFRAYRDLLDLIKRQPEPEKLSKLLEARKHMKLHMGETDPMKASEQLKELIAKTSFLRMMTPRQVGDRRSRSQSAHYIVKDGQLMEGEAEEREKLGRPKMSPDEAFRKHRELMKRQYFGQEPPKTMPPF